MNFDWLRFLSRQGIAYATRRRQGSLRHNERAKMTERWKVIKGFSHYEVSDFGRIRVRSRTTINRLGVRRFHKSRFMRTNKGKRNYPAVDLWTLDGKFKRIRIHILVLNAFVKKQPSSRHEGNHKDGIITNNLYKNLEWVTKKGNAVHARAILMVGHRSLTNDNVIVIRNSSKSVRSLAKKYDVHTSVIYNVLNRRTYAYV